MIEPSQLGVSATLRELHGPSRCPVLRGGPRIGVCSARGRLVRQRYPFTGGERTAILPDVGAAVAWPLPIYGHVYNAGVENVTRTEEERLERAYPRPAAADWLSYMEALAD